MSNRIKQLMVFMQRLDPAEAEIWISVYPEELTAGTEVRGRLMGPRCRYSSTVEVAYPLREWKRAYEKEDVPHLSMRVIIPEPSFWDPESPFLYEGPVELWHKKERCAQVLLSRGLRTVKLSPRGLRWNGRLTTIRGVTRSQCTEEEGLELHQQGCNTLLASVDALSPELWALADRLGFMMLGRIETRAQVPLAADLAEHPSCLGWILSGALLHDPLQEAAQTLLSGRRATENQLVGVELFARPAQPLPRGTDFLLCDEELLSSLSETNLPKIVLSRAGPSKDEAGADGSAGLLGSIHR
jgi:hypothetical protein